MPQLDKVTFLSQFFWLCVFFLGFYYVLLKYYLPKLSRILSVRQKKMGTGNQEMLPALQEITLVRNDKEKFLSEVFTTVKKTLQGSFVDTLDWVSTTSTKMNEIQYKKPNTQFVQSLAETSLSQNIVFYHARTNLPEKFIVKLVEEKLKTRLKQQEKIQKVSKQSPAEATEKSQTHKKTKK